VNRTALAVLAAVVVVVVAGLLTAPRIIAALRQSPGPPPTTATGTPAKPAALAPLGAEITCSGSEPGPGLDRCEIQWDGADLILRLPDGTPQKFVFAP
jgi:hypothetical protein